MSVSASMSPVAMRALGKVTVTGCTDRVLVTMVSGQCPAEFADRAEGIAHGFRVYLCRVRTAWPGAVVLELVRRDALAEPMAALPVRAVTDLGACLLEDAVTAMQARARRFAGRQRDHTPTPDHPFVVIMVDEIAFLTAYQADRKLRERTVAALATLTTQGRAVGFCVVAALQDPRKEVLNIRNLFPDKIALRLDEPSQADLVLGDGARDRGATCDQISTNPRIGAGVGYVRIEADPDPVRVRAAFVSDDDIRAMVTQFAQHAPLHALPGGEAA